MDLEFLSTNQDGEEVTEDTSSMIIAALMILPDYLLREVVRLGISACAMRVFEIEDEVSDEEYGKYLREVCRAFERSVNNLEPGS